MANNKHNFLLKVRPYVEFPETKYARVYSCLIVAERMMKQINKASRFSLLTQIKPHC